MAPPLPIHAALESFATDVETKFSANAPGQPEDQLRAPMESLLKAAGVVISRVVVAKGESALQGRLGRPDYATLVNGALTGYVELKAPGKGADPNAFKGRDRDQWKRFKAIPNLLYSDGNEFGLFRDGQAVGQVVRLGGDISKDGPKAIGVDADKQVQNLLTEFFSWEPIVPKTPSQLAGVLAPLCRFLRDQVRDSLDDGASPLVQLAVSVPHVLQGPRQAAGRQPGEKGQSGPAIDQEQCESGRAFGRETSNSCQPGGRHG